MAERRLYHFKTASGDAELIIAIKGMLSADELRELADRQTRDPLAILIPDVLYVESSKPLVIDLGERPMRVYEYRTDVTDPTKRIRYETVKMVRLTKEYGPAISRGKLLSSSMFIRTYLYCPGATALRPIRMREYGYKMYAIWCKIMELQGYQKPSYGYFRLLIYRLKRLKLIQMVKHDEWKKGTERSLPWVVDTKNWYEITPFGMNEETEPIWRNPQYALYEKPKGIMDIYQKHGIKADWPR